MKLKIFVKQLPVSWLETLEILSSQRRQKLLALALLGALCLNLILAPAVYAAADNELTRKAAYAIGVLLLVTLSLSIYLFSVIIEPERF